MATPGDLEDQWSWQKDSDTDTGSENEQYLDTMITRVGSSKDDQSNIPMPNLGNERKLVQKELDSGCGCLNCYSQYPENEI